MARLNADEPVIAEDCQLVRSSFGAYCELHRGCRMVDSELGDYSYCAQFTDMANTTVAKFSNIASYVRIGPTDHPMTTASLHHFLYRSDDYFDDVEPDHDFFAHRRSRRVFIGNDTWLGHGAVIRPEVSVGDGAIVATMAVVTKNVDPYTIVAGVPAKPIRARFPKDIADRLMALAWWDWDHETLKDRLGDFRKLPAAAFLEKYEP